MLAKYTLSCLCLNFLLLLSFSSRHGVLAGSMVNYLPGFSGVLPFKLETGYISVNESELFYLFVPSQGRPKVDPLLIYLVGGPGCSALNAFLFQTGPVQFNTTDYTGSIPSLSLYPYTWTKSASIIFVDSPVGAGFSYSTDPEDYYISDTETVTQLHLFLREWLQEYPQFINNQFYVVTDSYAGIYAPILALDIIEGNEAGMQPFINLRGIISGSPHTFTNLEDNTKIAFYHQMALISDSLYQAAKEDCGGNYIFVLQNNTACLEDLDAIDECVEDINEMMVLAPKCNTVSPEPKDAQLRRSLRENRRKRKGGNFPLQYSKENDYYCKDFRYILSYIWANNETVREALHVRKGTVKEWHRCNLTLIDVTYDYNVYSVVDYHKKLTERSIQVLLYTADHDVVVPHISTETWMSSLGLTLETDWRPWYVQGQIAGYTLKYTNYGYGLTYATLKGSGHSPTEWKGEDCFNMFERWIHRYPL
ncbi:hypothetical protein SLE2022_154860 [Rubroshorea leprosula]